MSKKDLQFMRVFLFFKKINERVSTSDTMKVRLFPPLKNRF